MTDFHPSPRYPDPAIEILDERFARYRLTAAAVERLYTGCRWAEGPVWFGDGRYVLWSEHTLAEIAARFGYTDASHARFIDKSFDDAFGPEVRNIHLFVDTEAQTGGDAVDF